MSEKNYTISEPFDQELNERLVVDVSAIDLKTEEVLRKVQSGKEAMIRYAEAHPDFTVKELLPLPEDSMEARLEEARRDEREACARIAEAHVSEMHPDTNDYCYGTIAQEIRARGGSDGEEDRSENGTQTEGHVGSE